jgi:hypothetical protein
MTIPLMGLKSNLFLIGEVKLIMKIIIAYLRNIDNIKSNMSMVKLT